MRIAFLLPLVTLAGCSGVPEMPVVTVDLQGAVNRTKIDLGTVQPSATLNRDLRVSNPTSAKVEIVRFESSCPCAAIVPSQLSVPAGGDTTCELAIDLRQEGGFTGQLGIEIDGYTHDDKSVVKILGLLDVRAARAGVEDDSQN